MRKTSSWVIGLALLCILAAAPAFAAEYEIAFSLKTITNDDFQRAIANSVEKAVKDSGHKFSLVTAGEQTAVSTQVNQVEDLIAKKVNGIILNPMDSRAVIPVLRKAKDAGIPVILVDTPVEPGNEDLYVTYIGTDNFNAGKVGGETLAKALGGEGNILIVRGANGNSAGDNRVDGFKAGIQGSGLKVVGEQPGDWTNNVAMQVMENMLQANSKVEGVFTASDVMLDGILTALEDAGRKNVKIMSVDGSKAAVERIEEGDLFGTMAQFPGRMGPKAVELLVGILDGKIKPESVEKYIDSGTVCYTTDNLPQAKAESF
jgi:ribose transport system substrate-binding protein